LPRLKWLNREVEPAVLPRELPLNREPVSAELPKAELRPAKFDAAREGDIAEFIAWAELIPVLREAERLLDDAMDEAGALPRAAAVPLKLRFPADAVPDAATLPRAAAAPPKPCHCPSAVADLPKWTFVGGAAPGRPAKPPEREAL
jgi:hypothetical protein